MAAPTSIRSGLNSSATNSSQKLQMEENDVFLSNVGKRPVGKPGGLGLTNAKRNVKISALGDASNKGRGGKVSQFPFKKPVPLGSGKMSTKSVSEAPKSLKPFRVRSNSVPVLPVGETVKHTKLQGFIDFFRDDDDWYPEPEFLRDISEHNLKDFKSTTSPFQIHLDQEEAVFDVNEDDELDARSADTEEDEADGDVGDYPEVEEIPPGYSSQMINDDFDMIFFPRIKSERDYNTVSEPPELVYEDVLGPFINDWLTSGDCSSTSMYDTQSSSETSYVENEDLTSSR